MGNRIRELRQSANISQDKLAERSSVPQSTLSRIEHGQSVSLEDARAIARALGARVEEVWPDGEHDAPDGPTLVREGFDQTVTEAP